MTNYERMKQKWQRRLKMGKAESCFDSRKLMPRKFCVHPVDCGGTSMSNISEIEITGYFDFPQDFLAYLRFAKIPMILDADTQTYRRPYPLVADAYLLKYETDKRNQLDRLLGQIDKYLLSGAISKEELSNVLDTFNALFMDTNPEVQILASGSVAETLTSPYFKEAEEEISPELNELLDSGSFDENNTFHLDLARSCFEAHFSA
jgi:hypothetical protein